MKINKFLVAALAATTLLASCVNDNDAPAPAGESATLSLNVIGNGDTKATGAHSADADIKTLMLFFFRGDGSTDRAALSLTTVNTAALTDIPVTSALSEVYAVANYAGLTSVLNTNMNKTALLGAIADINDGTFLTQTQIAINGVWQTGSTGSLTWNGNNTAATGTIALKFPLAKISFTVSGNITSDATVALNGVTMLQVPQKVRLFEDATHGYMQAKPSTAFYTGVTMEPTWVNVPTTKSVNAKYYEAAANFTTMNTVFFYVPESKSIGNYPVTLAVEATHAGKKIYFPVWFNLTDAKTEVEAGTHYTVTMEINSRNSSTEDPTDFTNAAKVTLTVTPATWTTKGVSKVFN